MAVAGGEPLPPGSCEHRNPATVSEGNSVSLLESGPEVRSIGGIPMNITIPSIPGYVSLPGQVLLAQYRFPCPGRGSLRNDSCRLLGTAQELAAACDASPSCQAVEFSPLGRDTVNASLGSLKGTPGDRGATLDLRHITWNPRAVLMVQQGVPLIPPDAPPDSPVPPQPAASPDRAAGSPPDSGLSAAGIAGIAVGAAAAVVLAAAAAAFVLLQRRRRRRQAEPGVRKPQPPLLPVSTGSASASSAASADKGPAVLHSPKASGLSSPRLRGSPRSAAAPPAGVPPGASIPGGPGLSAFPITDSERRLLALGASTSSSGTASRLGAPAADPAGPAPAAVPGLAPWALRLLSESAAGWEEAVVQEGEIAFLRGQDGQPICLGAGAFGSVWKVMLGGHTLAAAKVVEWGERARSQVEFIQARMEAALLRRLRHPNIVQFLSLCVTDKRGILLMEFCSGRDLDAAMHACSRTTGARLFDWYNRGRKVAIEIASGLAYLHHRRILHLDLKPHNVLMASDGTAKIGDVGFARLMHRTHLTISGRFGTFDWAAPEILMGRGATEKSDVYSFGVLLHGMCTGEPPRRGQMPPLRVPEHCPAEVEALYQQCTSEDPEERPSAAELLEALLRLPPARRAQQAQHAPGTPVRLSLQEQPRKSGSSPSGEERPPSSGSSASQQAAAERPAGSARPPKGGTSSLSSPFAAVASAPAAAAGSQQEKPSLTHPHSGSRGVPPSVHSVSWQPPASSLSSPFSAAKPASSTQPKTAAAGSGASPSHRGQRVRSASWQPPASGLTSPFAAPAATAGPPEAGGPPEPVS
ncbi:hypothetical protein ABPG75_003930 [Micractinium tetrahymenae]